MSFSEYFLNSFVMAEYRLSLCAKLLFHKKCIVSEMMYDITQMMHDGILMFLKISEDY